MKFFSRKDLTNEFRSYIFAFRFENQAEVAQLVERNLAKVKVAGSRPVFRSKLKAPF